MVEPLTSSQMCVHTAWLKWQNSNYDSYNGSDKMTLWWRQQVDASIIFPHSY